MASRLEIALKDGLFDAEGETFKRRAKEYFDLDVDSVKVVNILTVDTEQLDAEKREKIKDEIFTNPVTHTSSYEPLANDLDWDVAVWVGCRPGLMDPPGKTAVEAIEDLLEVKFGENEGAHTSKLFLYKGNGLTLETAEMLAKELHANPTVQQFKVFDRKSWDPKQGIGINIPKVVITQEPTVNTFAIRSDQELLELSKKRDLELNPRDVPTIRNYFLRPDVIEERKKFGLSDPTDVELEFIAQAKSDHCDHRTFNGKFVYMDLSTGEKRVADNLFRETIKEPTLEKQKRKDWIVSVLWDNAGIGKFDETWNYAISGETHNSPSNMDPYGGAITGNVGEFRDKMGVGLGSKVFNGLYGFCTGFRDYRGKVKPKLHPRRLLDGIIEGVKDGGNKMGIPTPFGNVVFDESYIGKCLVFVTSAGIMPAEVNGKPTHEKSISDGDLCIIAGGRVGKDGIHGVTAASAIYSEDTPPGHVQHGNPYMEKRVEGLGLAARDAGILEFTTDLGGGGNSSAIGESARYCGRSGGIDVVLDNDLPKYQPLQAWEIWVSESQERMLYVVKPEDLDRFMELSELWDAEARVLGTYRDHGKLHIEYKGKTVAHVDLSLLTEGFPQWEFEAEWAPPELRLFEPVVGEPDDHGSVLERMLERPNICSKEWVARQYDHEVQGGSVIKPMVGVDQDVHSDAVVTKPVLDSQKGFAVTQVINPWFSQIDTYDMTANVIDEAVRRIIAVGGDPDHIGGIDNFCWPCIEYDPTGNPDGKYKAAQLVRSCWALRDVCNAYDIPLLSGKDSMYIDGKLKGEHGEVHRISGKPTLQFTANSVIKDVEKCTTMDAKVPGDLVYALGETKDELGGSEYYAMHGHVGLNVPKVNCEKNFAMYRSLANAIEEEVVASAHAVSRGGLAVHLAEVAFAGGLGMHVDLNNVPRAEGLERNDKILYSESAGRLIVTIAPENKERFEGLMEGHSYKKVGEVTEDHRFTVVGIAGDTIIDKDIKDLKAAYKRPFGDLI